MKRTSSDRMRKGNESRAPEQEGRRNELRSRLQATPEAQAQAAEMEVKKKSAEKRAAAARKAWLVVLIAAVACLAWVAVAAASELQEPPHPTLDIEGPIVTATPVPTEPPESSVEVPTATPIPTPTPMIPEMAELYAQNPDLAGWIRIEDTVIDYPVMYTPDDGQFYLYRNFQREDDPSKQGCVFIDENCTIDPRSTNLLLHGHNMRNGSMFHSLVEYADPDYYAEHPTIQYTTLYDQEEYEIVYVFRSRVYNTNDDVFKYYKFYNAYTQDEFDRFVAGCEELSLYDTGIQPEFGDEFLTLNTCEYTEENGRMVIVARRIKPASEAEPTATAMPEPVHSAAAAATSNPSRLEEIKTGPGLLRQ